MNRKRIIPLLFVLAALCGCATVPAGPSISVLPAPGKPFEVFQADDAACRQWAQQQIGGASPGAAAGQSTAGGAAVGAGEEAQPPKIRLIAMAAIQAIITNLFITFILPIIWSYS